MPIPSRPIPTPAPRRAPTTSASSVTSTSVGANTKTKPGTSLPRRGLTFMDYTEIYDLPLPSSAPVKGLSGVSIVPHKVQVRVDEPRRMEVGVEGLILDGLGKREKRSTTATSLGFDFIPNPSIVALPDDQPTAQTIPKSKSTSRSTVSPARNSQSPSTPALVPTSVNEQEVDDEDDDWEHVSGLHQDREEGGVNDEGDMIFLGDLELEDQMDDKLKSGIKGNKEKSYAAVAGSTIKA